MSVKLAVSEEEIYPVYCIISDDEGSSWNARIEAPPGAKERWLRVAAEFAKVQAEIGALVDEYYANRKNPAAPRGYTFTVGAPPEDAPKATTKNMVLVTGGGGGGGGGGWTVTAAGMAALAGKLSAPQKRVLEDVRDHGDPTFRCRGRSMYGGLTAVMGALRRNRWIEYALDGGAREAAT